MLKIPAAVFGSLVVLGAAAATSHAVILAGYDLLTHPNGAAGNIASTSANSLDAGVASSTLSRGAGFSNGALGGGFSGRGALNTQNGGGTLSTPSNLADAITGNHYAQVDVSPAAGYVMALSSLDVALYQQNDRAGSTVHVHYSLDGFATAGVPVAAINPISKGWTGAVETVDLSTVAPLQSAEGAVTFRMYFVDFGGWEDRGIGQIVGNNIDLAINGVSAPIPEPAALGLLVPAALTLVRRRK